MNRSLVAALALSLSIPAAASAATDESDRAPEGSFVRLSTGKADVKRLTKRFAHERGAQSYLVWRCVHPRVDGRLRADRVTCRVRLRFRDVDGAVGYSRYTGSVVSSRGVRTTKLTPLR